MKKILIPELTTVEFMHGYILANVNAHLTRNCSYNRQIRHASEFLLSISYDNICTTGWDFVYV